MPSDEIKKYCDTVCAQIRWKKARNAAAQEIWDHICDQRDDYIARGDDEETAAKKAVSQMGDAVAVGSELDKVHRPKPQWIMIALTGTLMLIGMLANYFMDVSGYAQLHFAIFPFIASAAVFLLCYCLDFTVLGKYPISIYFITLAVSMMMVLPGRMMNGRIVWYVAGFRIDPVYLSLVYPLAYSLLVYAMRDRGYAGIIFCGMGYIPFAVILGLIPSASGLALFTLSALIVLCFAVIKGWFGENKRNYLLLIALPAACIAMILFAARSSYIIGRVSTVIDPYSKRTGEGYVVSLVRDLLGSSKFIGRGSMPAAYAGGIPKMSVYSTDFMLTILTHSMGWIVFIGISAIVAVFACLGLRKVARQKSVLGSLVSLSVMLTFVLQSLSYIMGNAGYGVMSSISLPFISYGKMALLINSALIGFMLSVFRTGDEFKDGAGSLPGHRPLFSLEGGRLIIDLKGGRRCSLTKKYCP